MFSKNSEKIYITIAAFFTVFLINYVFFLHAWNPPTAAPTGGNIELLNVGSDTQFKTGALGLGGNSKTSGIKINSGGATEPTCNANTRGLFWSKSGGVSEEDELIVCLKNSDDEYAWEFVNFWECGDNLIDTRDGNVYPTVKIGTQCWMAKNLAYLPSVVGPATGSTTIPYYYVYGYDGTDVNAAKATDNYTTYGVLYNWPAAMDGDTLEGSQGICPTGWHLPSDAEQHTLDAYLTTGTCGPARTTWDCDPAGTKLKTAAWGGDNSSGFTALADGYRLLSGSFTNLGTRALFWSSTCYSDTACWHRHLHESVETVQRGILSRGNGLSVRCLRD